MTAMPEKLANKFAEFVINEHKGKGPCLIPRPGKCAPVCHEKDFCECDMVSARDFMWNHLEPVIREMIKEIKEACMCTCECCKCSACQTLAKAKEVLG